MAERRPRIRTDIPASARIWNYWMGGKDNYEIDQVVGDRSLEIYPGIRTMAVQSRKFLIRAVRFVAAEAGVRQFLDIGTGLPIMQNTHQVAQGIASDARIVYVDHDPLVLTHARALLNSTTPDGFVTFLERDMHQAESILDEARRHLDFALPVSVMFMGVLGHTETFEEMRRIVATVLDAVPSGSYLTLWDSSDENENLVRLCREYAKTGAPPYHPRPVEQIRAMFDGLAPVEPGFVDITRWRTNHVDIGGPDPVFAYGAVARKP